MCSSFEMHIHAHVMVRRGYFAGVEASIVGQCAVWFRRAFGPTPGGRRKYAAEHPTFSLMVERGDAAQFSV